MRTKPQACSVPPLGWHRTHFSCPQCNRAPEQKIQAVAPPQVRRCSCVTDDATILGGLSANRKRASRKLTGLITIGRRAGSHHRMEKIIRQSEQLRSDSPSSAQNFVRRVVQRVVVHPDRIEVEVNEGELHAALAGDPGAASHQRSSDVVRLVLEARIKRCGGEMRLVVPPHLPGQVRPHPAPSLLKVVARAHQWCEWVTSGKVWGGRSIAEKTGLDERYASQILECAFLAPDIVDAILDGRQPADLAWKKLTRHVPINWVEQRKRLGFAAI
jgi:hypothetical protein